MDTERLIRSLAEQVEPVRPLRRPWLRTAVWASLAVAYLAVLIAFMSPRTDLTERMQEPRFLIEQAAALLTGLTAAVAAFATVVPGYSRRVILLPFVPLGLWIGIVGVAAGHEYALAGASVLGWRVDWVCVGAILTGAVVPSVAMGVMLRRGAAVTPRLSAAFGVLAAAGLGNLGVCLFHPHSSSLILLFWHCGIVLVLAALGGFAGAHFLRWPARQTAVTALLRR